MKNYKKLAAMTMAATMLVSSGLTVFAQDTEGTGTGNGKYEGYVEEVSAFSVKVPTTAAANQFDFFVDPNGLLESTDYAQLGAEESDFEDGATLYFTRTVAGSVTEKYGKDSDSITLQNMSSYDVDVEVTATITGVDGVTLAETDEVSDAEEPTIYLAIVAGSTTEAITSDGGKVTDQIAGEPGNFEIKWDSSSSKYVYGLIGTTDEENPTKPWKTLEFNLTGACGGTWTDAQKDVAPVVSLTWKVTDPNAAVAPSIETTTYSYNRTQSLTITTSFGQGSLGATAISKIIFSVDGTAQTSDYTSRCTINDNEIVFPSGMLNSLSVGGKGYLIVIFDDDAATEVVVTLNIAK